MKRILSILLCVALLLACQPTPDHEIIVNKGDGIAEDRIFAAPDASAAPNAEQPTAEQSDRFPTHWEADASTENVTVTIDADVIYPEGPCPVDRIENRVLTIADVNSAITAMYPNMIGYLPVNDNTESCSKEVWERILESTVRGFAHEEADGSITYLPWDGQNEAIQWARNGYRDAEEQEGRFSSASRLPEDFTSKSGALLLLDDGREIRVRINPQSLTVYEAQTQTWAQSSPPWDYATDTPITLHPAIQPETARETAERFIEQIGLSGELTFAGMEAACLESKMEFGYVSQGYQVEFTRTGSYPARSFFLLASGLLLRFSEDTQYHSPIGLPETMLLYVTENGVEWMEWERPYQIKERLNENVELLPFSEIEEIAIRYFQIGHAWIEQPLYEGFLVSSATLTVLPQRLKDDQGLVLMPVWVLQMDVYGTHKDRTIDTTVKPLYIDRPYLLLINAIDGSRVSLPMDIIWTEE